MKQIHLIRKDIRIKIVDCWIYVRIGEYVGEAFEGIEVEPTL
jgi:hypothetical protein